jgi:RNA polymerase sigma factor (sigma-70 family)
MKDADAKLVKQIQTNNDEESLKELISKHNAMYFSLYKKYLPSLQNSGIQSDDFLSNKDYIIYKSAKTFNFDKKTKFSTWLYNQIRFYCLNTINKNSRTINMDNSKITYLLDDIQSNEAGAQVENKNLNEYIFTILESITDKRIIEIYKLRYFSNTKVTSWSKIAKKLNISTQTAINLHKKGLALLKTKMNSNFYFEKV